MASAQAEETVSGTAISELLTFNARLAARVNELLAPTDLTLDRWRALWLVAEQPAATMSALAGSLCIPTTTTTRIVDHLVSLGAVYRSVDPTNRRVTQLQIGERGTELLQDAAERLSELDGALRQHLGSAASEPLPDPRSL